jgi:hypothetical protein
MLQLTQSKEINLTKILIVRDLLYYIDLQIENQTILIEIFILFSLSSLAKLKLLLCSFSLSSFLWSNT